MGVSRGDGGGWEVGMRSYQDGWVLVVHHVVAEAGAGGGYPAPGEALIKAHDAVGEVDPYQAVQPGNGCASGCC
jgi:hypothetical protein